MNDQMFYDKIYFETPTKWNNPLRSILAFYLLSIFVNNPKSLIDVGCGNGFTMSMFNRCWMDTIYYGVDLSSVAIEIAQKNVPEGIFVQEDFVDTKLPKFECALCMGVAEHFTDLEEGLKRLGEVGEYVYLEVPNCLAYSEDKEEGFRKTHEGADQDEWHLTRSSWEKNIKKAGLSIVERAQGPVANFEFIWVLK